MKRKQALERFEAVHASKPRMLKLRRVVASVVHTFGDGRKVRWRTSACVSYAESLRQEFAAMIIAELKRKKMSQAELSRLSGKQKSVIHRILQGKVNVTLRTIAEISFALGKVFIPKWQKVKV